MLLPRALLVLKLLELRGSARRMLKQMKRPAGALIVVAYICMFLPSILNGLFMRKLPLQISPEWILRGAPVVIGILCILPMLAPDLRMVLNFKPAEIDVLFTGPYSRRHVLTYKLLGSVLGSLFGATIMFLASLAFTPSPLPMFAGLYLAILFMALFGAAYTMLLQAMSSRVKHLGNLVAAGVVAAIGYAVFAVWKDLSNAVGGEDDPVLIYKLVFEHPVVRGMSLPFMPFAHVMAADGTAVTWALWTLVSAAIIVALYVFIVVMDADYMESAIARSAKQYAALERFMRGQFVSARAAARGRNWSLPGLPFFGGFGPVAWRQLTGMTHAWGANIAALYAIAIVGGAIVRHFDVGELVRGGSLPALMGILVYISVLGSNFIRFDFRSDIDAMDGLKTLPISARRVAAAQLVAPTVAFANVYLAVAIGTAIAVDRPGLVLIIGLLAGPFAALLMGVENATFLVWPTRISFKARMDVQYMARGFFSMLIKFLILGPACALAAGVAFACGYLLNSWALGYVAAAVVVTIEAALTVPAIAAAFEKFDPSADIPP